MHLFPSVLFPSILIPIILLGFYIGRIHFSIVLSRKGIEYFIEIAF